MKLKGAAGAGVWPKRPGDCPKKPPGEGDAPKAGVELGVPNGDAGVVAPNNPCPKGFCCCTIQNTLVRTGKDIHV